MLIFLFCLLVSSCASVRTETAAGPKSFLWSVHSEKSTVYLLGSIHVAKESLYPLRSIIEGAFDRSDTLVVEVNTAEYDPVRLQGLLVQLGTYRAGETLEAKLSPRTYALVQQRLKRLGLGISPFMKFKPWLLAITLENLELQRLGFDPQYGIDQHFLEKAQGKKRVLELETFKEQIKLFDGLTDHDQELFLRYTLSDLDLLNVELHALMKAWTVGDTDSFQRIIAQERASQPDLSPMYEELIDKRNRRMFSRIEAFLKTDGRYFIVVGAGHLVGKDGILELLRHAGYIVEQL